MFINGSKCNTSKPFPAGSLFERYKNKDEWNCTTFVAT
jgi:hypothetical protein